MTTKKKTPILYNAIGWDPGYGNTKVCVGGKVAVVQSAVSVPREVGMVSIGMKAAGRNVRVVEMPNGDKYAVGEGAHNKGKMRTSMDYSALTSQERRALFYAALSEAVSFGAGEFSPECKLAIGLPVPLLMDTTEAQAVIDSLRSLKCEHRWKIGDQQFTVNIKSIMRLAQPVGAYLDYAYDAEATTDKDGLKFERKQKPGVAEQEVLVIDIGMNTLDVYVVRGGEVIDNYACGEAVGVHRLLELLATNGRDVFELDSELRRGKLKITGAQMDSYLGEVLAGLKRVVPNLRRFDMVIPCGGGALVLGDKLQYALIQKGATVTMPTNPVETNCVGFWKRLL